MKLLIGDIIELKRNFLSKKDIGIILSIGVYENDECYKIKSLLDYSFYLVTTDYDKIYTITNILRENE